MTHQKLKLTLFAAVAATPCTDRNMAVEPETLVIPVFSTAQFRAEGHFGTHMTGAEETPTNDHVATLSM